tara:strand:+ start:629 stop:784 length:156 start_codon:yes stop_codon:yes gene_type:complete
MLASTKELGSQKNQEKTEGYKPVADKLDGSNGLLLSARIGQYVVDKTARGS